MLRTASLRAAHQLLDRPPVLVAALARRAGLLVATESASPPIAARQQTSLNVREAPRDRSRGRAPGASVQQINEGVARGSLVR